MAEKTTFRDAACQILEEAKEPLHYKDLTRRILDAGLASTTGKTPEESLRAMMMRDIKKSEIPVFAYFGEGIYGLRAWSGKYTLFPSEKNRIPVSPREGSFVRRTPAPSEDGEGSEPALPGLDRDEQDEDPRPDEVERHDPPPEAAQAGPPETEEAVPPEAEKADPPAEDAVVSKAAEPVQKGFVARVWNFFFGWLSPGDED